LSAAGSHSGTAAVLAALPAGCSPEHVDQAWIFSLQPARGRRSGLVVLALFDPQPDRRRVVTVRYLIADETAGVPRDIVWFENGSCPAATLDRVVEGVVGRLGEPRPPEPFRIDGDPGAWASLLARLSDTVA
jgi:hypothetical protein